jgi:hypothetical protein
LQKNYLEQAKFILRYCSFTSTFGVGSSVINCVEVTYWINSSTSFIEKYAKKKATPRLLAMVKTYREANRGKPVIDNKPDKILENVF